MGSKRNADGEKGKKSGFFSFSFSFLKKQEKGGGGGEAPSSEPKEITVDGEQGGRCSVGKRKKKHMKSLKGDKGELDMAKGGTFKVEEGKDTGKGGNFEQGSSSLASGEKKDMRSLKEEGKGGSFKVGEGEETEKGDIFEFLLPSRETLEDTEGEQETLEVIKAERDILKQMLYDECKAEIEELKEELEKEWKKGLKEGLKRVLKEKLMKEAQEKQQRGEHKHEHEEETEEYNGLELMKAICDGAFISMPFMLIASMEYYFSGSWMMKLCLALVVLYYLGAIFAMFSIRFQARPRL
ncbi:hypothetical protein Tsubulata_043525 [Turnera subulata]|uniref:Uncharacterized protein n=1 Tax=Turnera subulata TaxID=218843 RepID=A0A9Q0G454_9ROSI|nr:hypothetical protein Tsubulata_043525 [Turnera subulata]